MVISISRIDECVSRLREFDSRGDERARAILGQLGSYQFIVVTENFVNADAYGSRLVAEAESLIRTYSS